MTTDRTEKTERTAGHEGVPKPMSANEAELWALVETFTDLKGKLFNTADMSAGALASALETFRGLAIEQVALLLAFAISTKPSGLSGGAAVVVVPPHKSK